MKNLIKGLILFSLFLALFSLSNCSSPNSIFYSPCHLAGCKPKNVKCDKNGRKYKKKEFVLSFPQAADMIDSQGKPIDSITIKKVIYNACNPDEPFPTILEHSSRSASPSLDHIKVTKCICDDKIFLIEIDAHISSETGIVEAANTQEGVRDEGGIFSLNYIIENSSKNEGIPKAVVVDCADFEKDGFYSNDQNKPIVAILDSGIDANRFDDASGIYAKDNSEYSLPSVPFDKHGFNFIGPGSPNDDIRDHNGHGTLVSLAYKSKLDSLDNINWEDQRLLTVRVLDECGNGTIFSTTCGLSYARQKQATIINCSWGLYFNDIQLQRAIEEIPPETVIVCSAGNNGYDLDNNKKVHFPSGYGHEFNYNEISSTSGKVVSRKVNPMNNVFEVVGLDDIINYPCAPYNLNIAVAKYSNKRHLSFAEPANGVEILIENNPCPNQEIHGTSFAAPCLSAGLLHLHKNNNGSRQTIISDKNNVKSKSLNIGQSRNNWFYSRKYCK